MVKIFLGFFIIVFCTVFGKKYTLKFLYKLKFYECLASFNSYLKQNLMYRHDDIINLLDFNTKNQDFKSCLESVKLNKSSICEKNEIYLPRWADEEDKEFFTTYFNSLGIGNTDSEMENLLYYEDIINEKVKKIADKSNKFSNLGQKLGFAVGATVFIIIL